MNKSQLKQSIRELASKHGFLDCGFAKAGKLESHADAFDKWLEQGFQADMQYMENYRDKRKDPTKLVEGTKTVISLLFNYFPDKEIPEKDNFRISKYAYGIDYHFVVKDRLKKLLSDIEEIAGPTHSRVFIDTAPVLDRAWAEKSGLGWIGKNSMLISREYGSYVFIGEIITDLEIEGDIPINNLCGGCTKCIRACPTNAIIKDGVVDSNKCISYWTIENKTEHMPPELKGQFEDYIFGCDICQDVCPWNKFSITHNEPEFKPHPALFGMNKEKWQDVSEEDYRKLFKKSAVKRAKYTGLKRNIKFNLK